MAEMNTLSKEVIACARRLVFWERRRIPADPPDQLVYAKELKAREVALFKAVDALNASPEYERDREIEAEADALKGQGQ